MRPWALALGLAVGCGVALAAQPPVFRTGTDAVRVDVLVTDERGRPITGLAAADFALLDQGVPQRVETVDLEHVPLAVTLLLDVSGSVRGERLTRLLRAAEAVRRHLAPTDRSRVISFDQVVRPEGFAADAASGRPSALQYVGGTNPTSFFDAAYAGLALSQAPGARALLVVLSDGFDNRSWLDDNAVIFRAERSEVVVYSVRVVPEVDPLLVKRYRNRDSTARVPAGSYDVLDRLARATGGRLLDAAPDGDLSPVFVRVLDEFRQRYVVSFAPSGVPAAGWHDLGVKVRRDRARVTARRGYWRE